MFEGPAMYENLASPASGSPVFTFAGPRSALKPHFGCAGFFERQLIEFAFDNDHALGISDVVEPVKIISAPFTSANALSSNAVPVTNPEPQFIPPEGQPATAAEGFAEPIFFQAMQSVIAANPPPLKQRPLVASFRTVYANADLLTPQIVNAAQAAMSVALAASA